MISSNASVVIYINNLNDNAPVFNIEQYSFELEENVPIGTLVGNITVGLYRLLRNSRDIFGTQSSILDGAFGENRQRLLSINFFRKKLYLGCLTSFSMRFGRFSLEEIFKIHVTGLFLYPLVTMMF